MGEKMGLCLFMCKKICRSNFNNDYVILMRPNKFIQTLKNNLKSVFNRFLKVICLEVTLQLVPNLFKTGLEPGVNCSKRFYSGSGFNF